MLDIRYTSVNLESYIKEELNYLAITVHYNCDIQCLNKQINFFLWWNCFFYSTWPHNIPHYLHTSILLISRIYQGRFKLTRHHCALQLQNSILEQANQFFKFLMNVILLRVILQNAMWPVTASKMSCLVRCNLIKV